MKTITIEEIQQKVGGNVYEGIQYIEKVLGLDSPSKPTKPITPRNGSRADFRKFADDMEAYELNLGSYNEQYKLYVEARNKRNSIIRDYIQDAAGIYNIPEQYRAKVYQQLIELADIFE
jgi:hypothetical protein